MIDYSICATAPNQLYANAREAFLTGQLSWLASEWAIALLSASYIVDLDTDVHVSDLTGILAQSTDFQNRTATDGFAASDGITFAALDTSAVPITQMVIYQNSGVAATSLLGAHISDSFGLPAIGDGGDIILSYDVGFGGWFRL